MKRIIILMAVAMLALVLAGNAFAWHADGVSRDCEGTVLIDQSNDWPNAYVVSDDGSTVVIGWQDSEDTQTFQNVTKPEDCDEEEEPPVEEPPLVPPVVEPPVVEPPVVEQPPATPPCNGGPKDGGKDGVAGNDSCARPPVVTPPATPPTVEQPPVVEAIPVAVEELEVVEGEVAEVAKPTVVRTKKAAAKPKAKARVAGKSITITAKATLPYTGSESWMYGVMGILLIASGLGLRHIGRES